MVVAVVMLCTYQCVYVGARVHACANNLHIYTYIVSYIDFTKPNPFFTAWFYKQSHGL